MTAKKTATVSGSGGVFFGGGQSWDDSMNHFTEKQEFFKGERRYFGPITATIDRQRRLITLTLKRFPGSGATSRDALLRWAINGVADLTGAGYALVFADGFGGDE